MGDWEVAKNGYEKLAKCTEQVFFVEERLLALAELFKNLGHDYETNGERLRGVGLILEELSERLEKAHEKMEEVFR